MTDGFTEKKHRSLLKDTLPSFVSRLFFAFSSASYDSVFEAGHLYKTRFSYSDFAVAQSELAKYTDHFPSVAIGM